MPCIFQQSTSVYLKPGAAEKLQLLDVDKTLYDQLKVTLVWQSLLFLSDSGTPS